MIDPVVIDLFAEDVAHEQLLTPLLERIAKENGRSVRIRVRSARGGHGRVITEFKLYQEGLLKSGGAALPELLVVAIDANCQGFTEKRSEIEQALRDEFRSICCPAVPMPHIERWFLADLEAFHEIVGITPRIPKSKCERHVYKDLLKEAVKAAGHPATLGGIEFARELAQALDFYRAGKAEPGLKHFVDEATQLLKRPAPTKPD